MLAGDAGPSDEMNRPRSLRFGSAGLIACNGGDASEQSDWTVEPRRGVALSRADGEERLGNSSHGVASA